MTQADYFKLSLTNIYTFVLYYGRKIDGILVDEHDAQSYYIIKYKNIPDYNKGAKPLSEIGIPVTLESIVSHYPVDKNGSVNNSAIIDQQTQTFKKIKKLIIIGAGASYDFDANISPEDKNANRPPLCNDLFSNRFNGLLDEYDGAKNLATEITRYLRNGKSLEDYFQDKWNKVLKTYDPVLLSKIINSVYYIQQLFCNISFEFKERRENNYTVLVNNAYEYANDNKEQVVIVSFNYDTLIEEAIISSIGQKYNSINDYINSNNKILLFKPHGSWNWIFSEEFKSGMNRINQRFSKEFYIELFSKRADLAYINSRFNNGINLIDLKVLKEGNIADALKNQIVFYPSLLVPFKDKDDFVMPQDHLLSLQNCLSQIEDIYIIGWKGTEEKFNSLLSKYLGNKKVNISAFNAFDESIKDVYKNVLPNAVWKSYKLKDKNVGTFTEFADLLSLESPF